MTKFVQSAIYTAVGILALSGTASFATAYNAKASIDAESAVLDTDRAALANDEGILLKASAIKKQIAIIDARTGSHAKRVMIDRARSLRGIDVREFTLDTSGTQFTLKLVGNYDDIIAATVSLPAHSPGVVMTGLRIDADADDGQNKATATLTGMFNS